MRRLASLLALATVLALACADEDLDDWSARSPTAFEQRVHQRSCRDDRITAEVLVQQDGTRWIASVGGQPRWEFTPYGVMLPLDGSVGTASRETYDVKAYGCVPFE